MAFDQLAPGVIQRLSKDLRLTPQQAAGIVGQLGYESEGLQSINERKPVVPGSRGGYGWAQWTGPRRRQFEDFAAGSKLDVSDPEANYQFLVHELTQTPEGRVMPAIRGAQDAQSAGRIFTDQFLRPGVPAYDQRQSWTERALNFLIPAAQAGTLPAQGAQQASISDRIKKARDAGFNDEEILQRIQGNADMAQRMQKARDAGFTDEEIFGRMGLSLPATTAPSAEQPSAQADEPGLFQRAGQGLMEAGRQVGLTARYGLEGAGQAAQIVTEPLRMATNPLLRMIGAPEAAPTGQSASSLADAIGLPSPQGANERVVGDVSRLMAGAGGLAGGSNALARAATGIAAPVLQQMGSNPLMQIASGAGAGAAGGSVREAGGGPVAQAVAGVAGGVAGGLGAQAASSVGRGVANTVSRVLPQNPQAVDQQIEIALRQAGVNWKDVPARIQQSMRDQAAHALRMGDDLDPAAMRRLLDFERVPGATPTRGTLTLDPVQITREQNLAKTGANASDAGLQGLARVQNTNNRALIDALNTAGADTAEDAYAAGNRVAGTLRGGLDAQQGRVNELYKAARDSQGRSFPLDGASFTNRAAQMLDDNLVGGALPADVRNHLNRIAGGEVPFTVDYAEQLKTVIGRLQRSSSDGNARYALGLVRQALDDTPVLGLGQQTGAAGARAVNPGNLPAMSGAPELGEDAVAAFNQARSANRSMMQQIESNPALKALYDGDVKPEQFVQKFIIGGAAGADDVRRLSRLLESDPRAMESVRGQIAQWLKGAAIGKGTADEVGNFSAAGFRRAMDSIGEQKLSAFFSPDEIAQLRAITNVANYMKVQPAGSAVNNSNSGALVLGKGLDWLSKLADRVPMLGIGQQINVGVRSIQQGQAQRITPALVAPRVQQARGSTTTPAITFGSLFATPPVDGAEDRQRP